MSTPLGEKIRAERKKLKLTLEELAEKIEASKSYVWELENRPVVRPSAEKIAALASVFKVPVEYLVNDDRKELRPTDLEEAFFHRVASLDDEKRKQLERFLDAIDHKS
jgi:transcriptional regulator with XRE-family HTH domain